MLRRTKGERNWFDPDRLRVRSFRAQKNERQPVVDLATLELFQGACEQWTPLFSPGRQALTLPSLILRPS
jgi:hypothetical protein